MVSKFNIECYNNENIELYIKFKLKQSSLLGITAWTHGNLSLELECSRLSLKLSCSFQKKKDC